MTAPRDPRIAGPKTPSEEPPAPVVGVPMGDSSQVRRTSWWVWAVAVLGVGVAVGLAFPVTTSVCFPMSRVGQTRALLATVDDAIREFREDNGRLPVSLAELVDDHGDGWLRGAAAPLDSWGGALVYRRLDSDRWEVGSLGADGAEGGEGEDADLIHKDRL